MYRLYVDETGNADLRSSADPNHRYLSLTGIIVDLDHIRRYVVPMMNALKGAIFDPDPDEPIILHRKDILDKRGVFGVLKKPDVEARFNTGLFTLLSNAEYQVVCAVIDKQEHLSRYTRWRHDPYHYCMEVLVERYVMGLNERRLTGDVMGEVRGGKSDRRLEAAFRRLYERGSSYVNARTMQRCLTSHDLKLKPKEKNIAGLQLADILAHPSALHLRSQAVGDVTPQGFGAQIVELLVREKFRRSGGGRVDGYGTKWLP